MSSLKNFLYSIADDIGRPRESMDPVLKIFEDNWYDSVESIRGLDNESLAKMNLPLRVIELIRKKLGGDQNQSKEQPKIIPKEEHGIEKTNAPTPEEQAFLSNQISKVNYSLENLARETIMPHKLVDTLNILEKVLSNLVKDPANELFRSLKLTNEKLKDKFFAFPSVLDILGLVGFTRKDDLLYVHQHELNLSLIKQAVIKVEAWKSKATSMQTFDPYKSSFGTTGDVNVANLANQGPTNYDFVQKLEELKQKRDSAIKPYIENKEPKVYSLDANTSIQSFLSNQDQEMEEEDVDSAQYLFKQEILRWAKEFEANQNFTSRRKKEFEALLKQPLFTETKILLEAKFSPKEPVKNIVDLVKKYLVDPNWDFYLFQTPPVQKITSQNWNKSLQDAEMVPNCLLYFGTNQPLQGVENYLTLKLENM